MSIFDYSKCISFNKEPTNARNLLKNASLTCFDADYECIDMFDFLRFIPKQSSLLLHNSFLPNISCTIHNNDLGCKICVNFSLKKCVRIIFWILFCIGMFLQISIIFALINDMNFDFSVPIPTFLVIIMILFVRAGLYAVSHIILKELRQILM